MKNLFLIGALSLAALPLASCAPSAQAAVDRTTVSPVVYHLSAAAARGENVTVQGRYLGGPDNATIYLNADTSSQGGYAIPRAAVVSWSDREIVFTVPSNAPVGAGFLTVEVGGQRSAGLPFGVHE